MRILVQNPASKAFFDGTSWNEDFEQAKTFESVTRAEAACREQQFSSALIVVRFENARQEISYPVGAGGALLVSKPPTTRIKRLY
jgi:hypothetical protein